MRLDPMIQGFDYAGIARELGDLKPERITLGTLRADQGLFRFVRNGLFRHLDRESDPLGLSRYPFAIRLSMYNPVVGQLRDTCPLALCEESPEMWDALGLNRESPVCNCGI